MVFHGIWNGICLLVMGNPMSMEVSIEVSGWENHRTKWWIFQQAMFDYQRVICLVMTNIAIEAMAIITLLRVIPTMTFIHSIV